MRRSHKKDKLQPQLSHKIQSKLLISSKHISTLSSNILSKIDHIRNEQELQREYNLKFMTDRKKGASNQKSQKSLSSSKVTHKEHKQPKVNIVSQRLNFETQDYREKYYELHDEYLEERKRYVQLSEKTFNIKQSLCNFLSAPDSRGAEELAKDLESDRVREVLRRTIEQRRRSQAGQSILKEAMRILQVQSWEEVLHNLRSRVERFRSLDQCTFKILELESINKRVVNDFEEKLKKIRIDQEEGWQRERYLLSEDMESLKRAKECGQLEMDSMKRQFDHILNDLRQLASSDTPRLVSNRAEVNDLHHLLGSLKSKLQDIEVEAEDNMYKLLKSNQEMVKFQRNIEHIRGEMEQHIEELQAKNEQNECQMNHIMTQLAQAEQQIEQYKEDARKKQAEKAKWTREREDQWGLLAATLGVEESHPAKLLLKIKDNLEKTKQLNKEKSELKAALRDKDELNHDLQAELNQTKKTLFEVQESSKTALYEKEQYKFLLNNLRDQVSQMKRQHQQEKSRIIKQKDEEIIRGNQDILQSHESLSQQLSEIRSQYTKVRLQHEQAKTSLAFFKKKAEQQERQLIEKEGVVKKFVSECDRYKSQLRQIEGSFKEVVQLEEITSKRAITLDQEKSEQAKMLNAFKQRNQELEKNNVELNREKNELKTELSKTANDLKEVREHRNKCESLNVQLRLQALNKQSQISKLQERIKNAQGEVKALKADNSKLMSEVNAVTRKLIFSKGQIKKKLLLRFKNTLSSLQQSKEEVISLKQSIKSYLFSSLTTLKDELYKGIEEVKQEQFICNIIQQQRKHTNEAESQCSLLPSDLKENVINKLLSVLTTVSLLRGEKYEIRSEIESFQSINLEQAYRGIYEEIYSSKLKQLQGSIEMIKEESQEQSDYYDQRDVAKIISPEEIFNERSQEEVVNTVLQGLLDEGEIPALPYWQKIETNYLAIRRKLAKRSNLKLDISAIDARDPSITSPRSSFMHQSDLIRGIGTEPDDIFDPRETNREQRLSHYQYLRKENEQLKARHEDLVQRLSEDQQQLQALRGKLIKLQNETSIVGLQHNFRKIIEYLLSDNVDFFLQSCRIVMKMLHFTDLEIKDFQRKAQGKRKKKKSGFFTQFFKI